MNSEKFLKGLEWRIKKTRAHHQHLISGRGVTGTAACKYTISLAMDKEFYIKVFSAQRMQKYFECYPNDHDMALSHYKFNIELSESFYPVLSVFEVALRNSLNCELKEHFGSGDWYLKMESIPGLRNLKNDINLAKRHIVKRNENITNDKIVAELTLGFWVRLLNTEYELVLWKSLRKAFPNLKKSQRQRNKVSSPINQIRTFRNRVFHHEPISWNLEVVEELHQKILNVLSWLNNDLPHLVHDIDRVPMVLAQTKEKLN